MKTLARIGLVAVAATAFFATTPPAEAQVSVSIGAAPQCPYGYYDYAPYDCAPYGYYGPEWFAAGVFIGAGPWFHGPDNFRGHVDNHLDARHGYTGGFPKRGEAPEASKHPEKVTHFGGTDMRDGRGHEGDEKHEEKH